MPPNYFDHSFKHNSDAGMNHVRFVFYWEAYVKDSHEFMLELQSVAQAADKHNINVIYDNHQFHTSSWFNPRKGNGIPFISLSKQSHLILLTTVGDLIRTRTSSGGQIGGIELLKMQMVLMDGLYKLNSWRK
jgi:hypothetical protein